MKKRKKIFSIQTIIQFILICSLLIMSKEYILKILTTHFIIENENQFLITYNITFYIGLVLYMLYNIYMSYLDANYHYYTGRNYHNDRKKYNRTYSDLLEYFKNADPHKLDTSSFPKQEWNETQGLVFGKDKKNLITISSNAESNIAIFGPPGSGKTAGIGIINAMTFNGSVLAVDIKGDIYNYVSQNSNRKILRFCPDSPTALSDSCKFNPLSGINEMDLTEKKLYLEAMATILIPDEGGSDGNYFSSRARKMFQGITHLLIYNNPETSFPEIVHSILQGNIFDWVTSAMDENNKCIPARELLSSFYGNSEKNVTSAYDCLTTALVHFSNPTLDTLLDKSDNNCISIEKLEQGYDIYLQINQEHLDAYAPLFTLIIQSFSTGFTKRADSSTGIKNRPILMLLDEFPQLTFSYKLVNSNLSTLRSKSIICMLIQQNLSQLEYRYNPIGARSILGNCNYQIILGSNDINSSKIFSDTFGTRKVLKISNSETTSKKTSNGRSVQEGTEKIFNPEYFGDLSSQNKMIIFFKGKYIECNKLNCYHNKKERRNLL